MVCPNCKREADEGSRFCKYCGYSFSDNVLSSNNNVASVNKSSGDKAPAKKSNTVAIVLTILAAGVLLSAGIIFIGYNMIKGRSLEKYAEEKIIDDDDDKDVDKSKRLAELMADNVSSSAGFNNKGAHSAILRIFSYSGIPVSLVEVGFSDYATDAKILTERKEQVANGIVKGIDEYFSGQ